MPAAEPVRLEVVDAVKEFPGVRALDRAQLRLRAGEVHALVGENGAGKSSLIKALAGVHQLDTGQMTLEGVEYRPTSPHEALASGVRVVHQELSTLSELTVAENLFFEHLPRRRGLVDYRRLNARAEQVLATVGLDVSPRRRIGTLSIAQTQLVEIGRAVSADARVIIFDEPTASLTAPERDRLFEIIAQLRGRGTSVLYISHHLEEIFDICETATVLRNGRTIATRPVAELTSGALVTLMVGRELAGDYPFPTQVSVGKPSLQVQDLAVPGGGTVSFTAHAGEILGVAGLIGAGRTETMRAVFGADRHRSGQVLVDGRPVRIRRPRDAVRAGISLATEDRKNQGLILPMGVDVNISIAALKRVTRLGFLRRSSERQQTRQVAERMRVKTPSLGTPVRNLSGGNQQKVVLARWLFRDTLVLIVDEPTRGIDVGARYEVYELLAELAGRGVAIVMVSSDLKELIGMCHRILVFSRGTIAGDLRRDDFDEERILGLAYSGYVRDQAADTDPPSTPPDEGSPNISDQLPDRTRGVS
jgi:ribose transport system ATP-binding protein